MSRNSCLNLLKCIACFGVVFIHVTFPGVLGDIVKYSSTFAVPLFMMIAGYYSYGCDERKIKQRLVKIIKILLFGYICFFVCNITIAIKANSLLQWFSINYNWKNFILFFCFCTIRWAIPLWYLIAMTETYFFWMIVVKKKWQDAILKITPVLFIVGTVLAVFVDTMGLNWSYKINFICRALPWFMYGYIVKERYYIRLKKVSTFKLLLTALLGWGITLSAILLKTKVNYNSVGVLLTAPALFMIGIKNSNIKVNNLVEFVGDKLSLFIYILHPLVSILIMYVVKFLRINWEGAYLYVHPIITLIVTIGVSLLFYLVFKNKKIRHLLY